MKEEKKKRSAPPPGETPQSLREEVWHEEARVAALRRRKEELLRRERDLPGHLRMHRVIAVTLHGLLWIAGVGSALLLLWYLILNLHLPH